MKKVLTISVAAYNTEKYIRETLESLTGASRIDELEVFVIDDGGNDETMKIAETYRNRYPESVFLIHKENGGWGSTVNYSIANATGKYLKLLDGDDYFDCRELDSFIEYLLSCDTDVVCTPFQMFDDDDSSRIRSISLDSRVEMKREYGLSDVSDLVIRSMHALTFKTEVLRLYAVSLMEHCFYTDTEYITKGFRACKTISFCDTPLYWYRIARADRSCGLRGINKHYEEHRRVLQEMIEFRKSIMNHHEKNLLVDRMVYMMVGKQYRVYLLLDDRRKSKELFLKFDSYLKEDEPELYAHSEMGRVLKLCKKIPGLGFGLARVYYRSTIR